VVCEEPEVKIMEPATVSLNGKIAMVTGGSRGIGRAAALALATAGAKVAVNYNTHAADADAVCAKIMSAGGRAIAVLDVNLKSVFLVTQAALPSMRAVKWGRIINLSSVAAQTGGVIGPHYAASKAGIIGLTHSYAALLAKEGITVNAIAPALIETDMIRDNPRATPALIPVGRFGTVEEVADVVVTLATNGYITGQTINVNGGWYMS
jgi:3-oxoacyl-[acyl-carrier protein] reductase